MQLRPWSSFVTELWEWKIKNVKSCFSTKTRKCNLTLDGQDTRILQENKKFLKIKMLLTRHVGMPCHTITIPLLTCHTITYLPCHAITSHYIHAMPIHPITYMPSTLPTYKPCHYILLSTCHRHYMSVSFHSFNDLELLLIDEGKLGVDC